jgi:hypothetical protein
MTPDAGGRSYLENYHNNISTSASARENYLIAVGKRNAQVKLRSYSIVLMPMSSEVRERWRGRRDSNFGKWALAGSECQIPSPSFGSIGVTRGRCWS